VAREALGQQVDMGPFESTYSSIETMYFEDDSTTSQARLAKIQLVPAYFTNAALDLPHIDDTTDAITAMHIVEPFVDFS